MGRRNPPGTTISFIKKNLGYQGDDCLVWPFSRGSGGYGLLRYKGRHVGAHRAMCIEAKGTPPSDIHVAAHSCGNGHLGCVNPRHISWKTPAENNADKLAHGTHNGGSNNHRAKLTEREVLEIRRLKGLEHIADIARSFGVVKSTVSMIHTGKTWTSVQEEASQ